MGKIDLTINKTGLAHNIRKAKENNVIIPTIAQMQHPETIPEKIQEKLKGVGLWDVNPLNLFRITWKNEAKESGGLFQAVPNYVEIPPELSGVKCRILAMAGKWFPTGCHKVGASFGCLAPRLVTGQFDADYHHAVWPSTGNYCRGGAFNSKLLAVDSVAILPAEMSKERFEWLSKIAGQVIATPGCESNVKEIFDKTWELKQDPSMMIFNQFEEMGNPLWHYNVTGCALADLFEAVKKPGQKLAGACFTSGSAGTMSAGDLLKERYPGLKLGVGEALTSFLDEQGVPTIVQRTKIVCPQSLMGLPEPMARMKAMLHDGMEKYDDAVDNLSAYEVLTEQADAAALQKQQEEDRLAQERLAAEQEKQRAKEEAAEEKRRQKLEDEERRRAQKLEDEERRRAQKLEDEARRRAERAAEAEQKKLERQREREAAAAKKKAERLQSKIETQLVSAGGRILRRGLLGILKR